MGKSYLNIENLFKNIQEENFSLIFLTGKTSTGKTTFSNKLTSIGYQVIKLDDIIISSIYNKYNPHDISSAFAVYKGNVPVEWAASFIQATREEINLKIKYGPVLIEGTLANNEIIKKIFNKELQNFQFVFLLPVNVSAYTDKIRNRFVSGITSNTTYLPEEFFKTVSELDIKDYLRTMQTSDVLLRKIENFARWSMEESLRRLDYFNQSFSDIIVVEV
jgi:AAA+ ATPase superfamily predicted ATPase